MLPNRSTFAPHRRCVRAALIAISLLFGLAPGAETAAQAERANAPSPERRELLNSERIAQRFGSYGIEVLESDGRVRVSNLYSNEQGGRICRTFAVRLDERKLSHFAQACRSRTSGVQGSQR